jgi:hypothetical protein
MIIVKLIVIYETNRCSINLFHALQLLHIAEKNIWNQEEDRTRVSRRLHNEKLHNLYSFPNIMMFKSRLMRWVGRVKFMSEETNTCKVLVGKPEEEGPLGG